jgi:hypothetical protein
MQIKGTVWTVAATVLVVLCGTANADPIAVFNSGVDAQGNVLAPGAPDPHYTLVSVPQGDPLVTPAPAVVQVPHPVYLPNDPVGGPGSAWIGSQQFSAGQFPSGVFVFRTTFDLTGFDAATAVLQGNAATDNTLDDVILNGTSLGISGGQFIAFSVPFTISTGFVDGVNTIDFVVRNLGTGPSGFRALLSGDATLVPEKTVLAVDVEVKPHRIRTSRGVVLAGVLSTEDFDATDLDLDSVTLAGAPIVSTRSGRHLAVRLDVNRDGLRDLLFIVDARKMDIEEGDTSVDLAAALEDGTEVFGSAEVEVVSSGSSHCRWRRH